MVSWRFSNDYRRVSGGIVSLLKSLPGITQLNIIDAQLVDNITGHLMRCIAAPVWIPEHRQGSMNNLKAHGPPHLT
jgi:putative frv operon regulatory protein